jgi:hypothetical protein
MMTTPEPGPSNKLVPITCALLLNNTHVAAVKVDMLAILTIDDNIKEYRQELQLIIDLEKEIQVVHADNLDYARHINILEGDLQMANKKIQILQGLMTNTLTLRAIKLSHPPEYSTDRKELPNFISKVHSKLAGQNDFFLDNQYKIRYDYGYLKGNTQNQSQPYIQMDNISLEDIEALIKILEATFGNPDEVRTASGELDYLM